MCLNVESALHRHSAVAKSCAFSVPLTRFGDDVGAAIQSWSDMNTTHSDIQAFLNSHIAHLKILEHIWIMNNPLPRDTIDKLDRLGLHDIFLDKLAQST